MEIISKPHQPTLEQSLYISIFLLGFCIRIWGLGAQPLSDNEARWALSAYDLAKGNSVAIGSQVGYSLFTGLLFWIIQGNNFLARFWPALTGSLLILSPYLFRKIIGRNVALIMAVGFALDPILIYSSRMIGSSLPSITFGIFIIGCLINRCWSLAGLFAGLYLLSGTSAAQGLTLLILTGMIYWIIEVKNKKQLILLDRVRLELRENKPGLQKSGMILLIVLLALGTLFFLFPEGLSAILSQVTEFIAQFGKTRSIPYLRILLSLMIYQPILGLFGLIGMARYLLTGLESPSHKGYYQLWILFYISIIALIAVKPGRDMFDLVWISVPFWLWASMEISKSFTAYEKPVMVSIFLALILFIVAGVFWLQITSLNRKLGIVTPSYLELATFAALICLVVLSIWLVASGWSMQVARLGVQWGVLLILGVYVLANIGRIVQLNPALNEIEHQELCYDYPLIGQSSLLNETITELSQIKTGRDDLIDIQVMVDSPAMQWMLRDYAHVTYLPERLSPTIAGGDNSSYPSIFITRQNQSYLSMPAVYRGQDFTWYRNQGWTGILPPRFLNWFILREAPWSDEQIILWAKSDLFPGGSTLIDMGQVEPKINVEPPSSETNP
jgi:hypothetical protein